MKRDTKRIGTVSELMVITALVRQGYVVSVPLGDSSRYDAVVEREDGTLARVQIKTGRLRNGAIEFNGYSTHTHRGGSAVRRYVGEVEFFGVYCPQVDQCFLIPAEEVPSHASLRVVATRNRQARGIKWAADYALVESVVGANGQSVVPSSGKLPL